MSRSGSDVRIQGPFGTRLRPLRRAVRDEGGATMVELAVSGTVMLSLLFGMLEMFLCLYGYHYTAYAAREGSRWAMVRGSMCNSSSTTMSGCNATTAQIQTFVQGLNFPGINSNHVTASATWYYPSATTPTTWTLCTTTSGLCTNDPAPHNTYATPVNAPGNLVKVKVTYAFPLPLPFNSTLNMTSSSGMVITQ